MDDEFHYYQQYATRHPYLSFPYHRNPYMIPRRHFEDDYSDYYREFKTQSRDYDRRLKIYQKAIYYIRVMAYIQIFIAGVLLVSDVSRIVLLWTFVQSAGNLIEMICQLSFPLFSLILGFLSLTCALSPSSAISKSVVILLVATVVPNLVFPRQAAFITSFYYIFADADFPLYCIITGYSFKYACYHNDELYFKRSFIGVNIATFRGFLEPILLLIRNVQSVNPRTGTDQLGAPHFFYAPLSASSKSTHVAPQTRPSPSAEVPFRDEPRVDVDSIERKMEAAVDAVEVARAADRTLVKQMSLDMSMGMIRSATHHKLLRMLSSSGPRWPLGIQDISSLPADFLVVLQYLLVSYAMFAFLQLVFQIIIIYSLIKLLTVQ